MAMQGIGAQELAQKAGLSPDVVFKIFKGRRPNIVTIGKLAAALNIEPKKLLKDGFWNETKKNNRRRTQC
jgi:transcriptional regulator with XRE-family HTH domain